MSCDVTDVNIYFDTLDQLHLPAIEVALLFLDISFWKLSDFNNYADSHQVIFGIAFGEEVIDFWCNILINDISMFITDFEHDRPIVNNSI